MIIIDTKAFRRIVDPVPDSTDEIFVAGLKEIYGIIHMIPIEPGVITTDWFVIFDSDNSELMFRLKHGECL